MEKLRDINPAHERFGYLSLVVAGAVVLAIGLLVRSDLFLSVIGFVLEIIGWLGILGGAAIAAGGVSTFGNERGWWDRLIEFSGQSKKKYPMIRGMSGSAVFLLVLVFFFLPWMSVSCFGDEVLTASGADVMGITRIDDIPSDVADGDYGIGDALGSEAALLYVAALLAIAGGALFFLPERRGSYIRAGIAGAGLLCILAFVFLTLLSIASEMGVGIGELEDAGIVVSWKFGLWLSLLGFIAAAALQFVPMPFADRGDEMIGPGNVDVSGFQSVKPPTWRRNGRWRLMSAPASPLLCKITGVTDFISMGGIRSERKRRSDDPPDTRRSRERSTCAKRRMLDPDHRYHRFEHCIPGHYSSLPVLVAHSVCVRSHLGLSCVHPDVFATRHHAANALGSLRRFWLWLPFECLPSS